MFFKTKKFFFLLLAIVSIGTATFYAPDAYADYTVNQGEKCQDGSDPQRVTNNGSTTYTCADTTRTQNGGQQQTGNGAGQGGTPAEGTTCAVEKIGWIVCPVIEGAAKMTDYLFKFLATYFLEIEPELLTSNPENGKGTITAWEQARNLANIMFVIAFIIIIYSQITGAGLNNYGIKRMLPRLIIAALAVNVSYYICQAMVDFSNILGFNIMKTLQDISNEIGPSVMSQADQGLNTQTSDGTLAKLTIIALAAAGIVWVIMAVMSGSIFAILIICLICIIILLLRKAFIVLLVVASPIAFVMYLLPNTEKYFSKWLNMFWNLLLVFPIVALLLGGGQLASTIILVAGSQEASKAPACDSNQAPSTATGTVRTDTYGIEGECSIPLTSSSGKSAQATLTTGFVAAGIAVAPLLAVWSVLQGALAAAGAIGGKISGAVSQGTSGAVNKSAKWAGENTALGRGIAARKAIRQNYKNERFAEKMAGTGRRGRLTRTMARGVGGNLGAAAEGMGVKDTTPLAGVFTGSMRAQNTKLSSNFAGVAAKIDEQDTKDKQALMQQQLRTTRGEVDSSGNVISDDKKVAGMLEQAITNGDKAGVKAATNMLLSMGGPGRDRVRNAMGTHGTSQTEGAFTFRHHITNEHGNLKSTDADVYAAASDDSASGLAYHQGREDTFRGLTNDQFATQSGHALSTSGARTALRDNVAIVDEKGQRYTVRRGRSILGSKAGAEIKGSNRDHFDV